MKFDKSTKILINLVLILVIAFLLKSIIAVPKNLYARNGIEYKVVIYEDQINLAMQKEGAVSYENRHTRYETPLNEIAAKGWTFHSHIKVAGYTLLVFER